MRTLYPVALAALVVSCHIDKLFNSGGGNGPPSQAAPARVAFSSSLGNARAGQPISPPVQVTVQDSTGRVTLRDTLVTLSLAANPSGDSLRGKKQVRSINGVATFDNVRLDKAASGYRLTAAAPDLHPDTSGAFIVMPAPATVLAFSVAPGVTMQDSAIKPPVQVAAFDASEHVVQGFTGTIGLALEPASIGGTLSGGTPINAVNGIATFPSLSVDKAGTGYTLRATASGLTDATSSAFAVAALPNQSPTAAFPAPSCSGLTCSFTDQSSDPDGTIASRQWNFGDGSATSSQANPSHTYAAGGTFTVTLTVTDNQNATGSVSHPVTVTAPPPPNQPALAAFPAPSCSGLTCSFTDQSTDPDGTIASRQWNFGDGSATSSQANALPIYAAGGTFTVTLTVTDNQNATGSVSHPVTVTAPPPPNQPPTAAFPAPSCSGLTCSFTDQSTDPDGTIASRQWNFGDGTATSSQANPSHTYTAGGTFTVTLTVTDNQNATGSVSHPVTVTAPPPPNQPPSVSAGAPNCSGLTCSFTDESTDPDGTIASRQWNFGDGSATSSQANPSHTYTAGGTFTVTLTVTDNQNATGSVSHPVTVTAPPPPNQPPTA